MSVTVRASAHRDIQKSPYTELRFLIYPS